MTRREKASRLAAAERFKHRSMAERYRYRPPYSREVYETLLALLGDEPRTVLDAGCGPGKIARELVDFIERVDAVDFSQEMLRVGRSLPNGDHPNLRWICGPIETAPLSPPYALIIAGASFHWMDPGQALRRFQESLTPNGVLVVLDGDAAVDPPWGREEFELGGRAQTEVEGRTPEWFKQPYPPPLVRRPLVTHPGFRKLGEKVTRPMPFEQSVEDYIECLHSRASYCREVLGEDVVRRFDSDLAKLLSRFARDGRVRFSVQSRMEWGRPDMDSGAHGRQDPDEECR